LDFGLAPPSKDKAGNSEIFFDDPLLKGRLETHFSNQK
jgi:hypothetical protein